jgi:cytochrome c556
MTRRALLLFVIALPFVAQAEERHLGSPPLSETARALVRQKMAKHSRQMTELVWSVVLLEYNESAQLAQAIATEPRLARPTSNDATELNAALPPRFFELQDQLRSRAQKLEVAARARDATGMAKTFGALAETCVACHDVYLSKR